MNSTDTTAEKTICINNGYVEIGNIPSPYYGTTTAAGSIEQALNMGFLSCGDGQNYKLSWSEQSFLKRTGIIIEITEERFFEALEVLPPAYLETVNNEVMQSAFAVCEMVTSNKKGGIWNIYFQKENKYFTAYANIVNRDGKYFQEDYNMEYSRQNQAFTLQTVKK